MATVRLTRRRKDTGLRKYIIPLYREPVLRFLHDEERNPVRDLIYGPGSSRPPQGTPARKLWDDKVSSLKPLWQDCAPIS